MDRLDPLSAQMRREPPIPVHGVHNPRSGAADVLHEIVKPGMREFELAADLYCHMKGMGAEDNFLLLTASQHNQAVRAAGHRKLDVGDIIISEITPCYKGQFVQICRTTVIGEPSQLLRDKYKVLQDAMHRGQEAARPGVKVKDVANAINDVFREAGYGKYCQPPYMRVRSEEHTSELQSH